MEALPPTTVSAASSADLGTVQGVAAISMLRKSMDVQKAAAAQLIAALPQPPRATSGSLGTQIDTYA
jgi:Putative motility protein